MNFPKTHLQFLSIQLYHTNGDLVKEIRDIRSRGCENVKELAYHGPDPSTGAFDSFMEKNKSCVVCKKNEFLSFKYPDSNVGQNASIPVNFWFFCSSRNGAWSERQKAPNVHPKNTRETRICRPIRNAEIFTILTGIPDCKLVMGHNCYGNSNIIGSSWQNG